MKREIKFRAWDKEEKQMISAEDWYFSDEFEPFVDAVERAQEDFELMQFTGLKDREGKEIYEGDLVHLFLGDSRLHEIIFDTGCFGYLLARYQDRLSDFVPLTNYNFRWSEGKSDQIIVIGNRFENPDPFKWMLDEKETPQKEG